MGKVLASFLVFINLPWLGKDLHCPLGKRSAMLTVNMENRLLSSSILFRSDQRCISKGCRSLILPQPASTVMGATSNRARGKGLFLDNQSFRDNIESKADVAVAEAFGRGASSRGLINENISYRIWQDPC
jgi:hypothetical protein